MKTRLMNSRRGSRKPFRALFTSVESLEQRRMLSFQTITNDPNSAPADGAVTVTVDTYGSFTDKNAISGALYKPFVGGDSFEGSVAASAIYFQPAGGFLTENANIGTIPALPGGTFTQTSVNSVTSEFEVTDSDGGIFDITLTQTLPNQLPSTDSTTNLIQTYTITNVSSTEYDDVPFTIVRYLQSTMPWGGTNTGQDWGGLSGDNRIAISFDDLSTDSPFERIDIAGIDSNGNQVADWADPVNAAGASIVPNGATTSRDPGYYQTIIANQGIPVADNGVVAGDTNGDFLDDTNPATPSTANFAVLALSDSVTIPMGQSVTYIATTGWGDTGTEQPVDYRKPGTWDVTPITTEAPKGTNADLQVFRTDGSLGHATVDLVDDTYVQPIGNSLAQDPNAVVQWFGYSNTPPNPILVTLLDGQTSTGLGNAQADPLIPVFANTKIQGAVPIEVQILNPGQNSILAVAAPNNTTALFTVPASNEPSPFHFATIDPNTGNAVTTSWNEGTDNDLIAVERDGDDNASPTNSGPYGTFSVQYTITGSGSNPATPGVDFVDNTPGSTYDSTTDTYTGSLTFPAADDNADAQLNQYQYINLSMLADNLYEGPETFTITLQNANPLLITSPNTFTGTIQDLQTSGPVHLQYTSQSVAENAGTENINVVRSGSTNGQVLIDYSITGGSSDTDAIPGVDFTVPGATLSGDTYSGSITFPVGSALQSIPIDLIPTDQANPPKTLTISISDPNNIIGLLGTPSNETLTITNNNTPGEVYFLGGAAQSIEEGPDPTTGAPYKIMTLQVTRDPNDGAEGAVSVDYSTADGTAVAGTDYQSTSGTLNWANGQTGPMNIQVKVFANADGTFPVTPKTFSINLSDPTGGVSLATPSSVVVTILNDQHPGINLSDSTYTAYEKDPSTGQPGTANIVVERDLGVGQSAAAWSFTYTLIPGTAQAGLDYIVPASTTVNVSANQSTYTIPVPILADDNNVNDTSFSVRLLSGALGGSNDLGNNTSATVTITNADADIALSSTTYTAAPGSGTVPITINRTGRSDAAIIVSYTTADGTAKAGTDYTATSGSVTIPAGQNSVTLNVPILTAANSDLPTRSFSFKITNAVLADPTDFANAITVNFASTASTISVAGMVSVTGLQLEPGKGGKIGMIVVTFSDPLGPTGVDNPLNYVLTTSSKKGVFNSDIVLTNAEYNASTQSVTLFTKSTLSTNKLYQLSIRSDGGIVSTSNQPFVTGAPGGLGGTQVAVFSTGTKVTYTDPDGDIVTLKTKKGARMQFIDGMNGSYPSLILSGSSNGAITGSLKADGDGHTIIASVTDPSGVQDLLLDNPQFTVE